jgi:hypothetical protein
MQRLIACRQLTGDYGTVAPGGVFTARDDAAHSLLARGLARPDDSDPILRSGSERDEPALTALREAVLAYDVEEKV